MTVAALYIDPLGPYPKISGVECWDRERNADFYPGPWPVVAHPPCGQWSSLRFIEQKPSKHHGPIAVGFVRRYGGVLEHPAYFKLFDAMAMPRPGELPDASGGFTLQVEQVAWGHVARKKTWLYFVGVDPVVAMDGVRTGGKPTHWVSGFRSSTRRPPEKYGKTGASCVPPGIKVCSAEQRLRTPLAFAAWLCSLAAAAHGQTIVLEGAS